MFDFKAELEKYGLTEETYEACLKDASDKVQNLTDIDWQELVEKYNLNIHYDTLRKSQQPSPFGGAFIREYFMDKMSRKKTFDSDTYLAELKTQKDEIYKEKRKLYDQRREYNKLLTSDARAEHLTEELIEAANRLAKEKPLIFEDKYFEENTSKEALLLFSDWHYGMVTDNIWNTYNVEICKERVKKLVEITTEFLKLNKITTLHIGILGDCAHGAIHTSCRVNSEEDVCDQLMHVSEIIGEAIDKLSKCVNKIHVYSCYGNHLRTVQKKDDSVHSDNMEKIIPWWLRERLRENPKVDIIESEYKEFTRIDILGKKICCVHGDNWNFKDIGATINTIFSRKFNENIDYTFSGDKHHLEEFERYGIESVLVRSLCGTDDYANDHHLYSTAGQTLMIFNDVYGREATYHIPLDK